MSTDVPIRYAVSIVFHEDHWWGVIYYPKENEYAKCSNRNLTKLMNLVSSRIRKKERDIKNFPVIPQEEKSVLILPNGEIK